MPLILWPRKIVHISNQTGKWKHSIQNYPMSSLWPTRFPRKVDVLKRFSLQKDFPVLGVNTFFFSSLKES